MLAERKFYRFVREERLFCAALVHLLMQRGRNLGTFLDLINAKLPPESRLPMPDAGEAEIYIEFTFLRDSWNALKGDNDAKRKLIFDLFRQVDTLNAYGSSSFPASIPTFNQCFMGDAGLRIARDIVYPGQWRIPALEVLAKRIRATEDQFRDFCRFKWAFNIKPDLVILLPGSKPLCIEAKLESREGQYPTNPAECLIFDNAFGPGKRRVGQMELQQFMFGTLLNDPCDLVVIGRRIAGTQGDELLPFLNWEEVFKELDLTASIKFVQRLVEDNVHLPKALMPASGQGELSP